MKLRNPNLALFFVGVLLAIIGVWEYLGAPLSIPAVSLPMIGLSTPEPSLSTAQVPGYLTAHAFWIMLLAWVLLAIGNVLPHRARAKSLSDHYTAAPKPAA